MFGVVRVSALAGLFILLVGCVQMPSNTGMHESVASGARVELPRKILFLPPEVSVHEVSAGGVGEKVEAWTQQASGNVKAAVSAQAKSLQAMELVPAPQVSAEDEALLAEYRQLYAQVLTSAMEASRPSSALKHRRAFTLGPGLAKFAEQTGQDAALFLVGADYISSGGRKATMALFAMLGMALPALPTFVAIGVVDLRTGDLLWYNYDVAIGIRDLRIEADAQLIVQGLFSTYKVPAKKESP